MGSSDKKRACFRGSVLLVEDYTDTREMYGLLLETLGYRVHQAKNAEQAINLAIRHLPDIVLTDLGLPKVDGIEFVRRLRNLGGPHRRVPVIMMSAFDKNHYYSSAKAVAVNVFLTKPVDLDILEGTIDRCLRNDFFVTTASNRNSHPARYEFSTNVRVQRFKPLGSL